MAATHDLHYLWSSRAGLLHRAGEQRSCPGTAALQGGLEGPMPPLDTQPPALVLCTQVAAVGMEGNKYVTAYGEIYEYNKFQMST